VWQDEAQQEGDGGEEREGGEQAEEGGVAGVVLGGELVYEGFLFCCFFVV
jgi:hypothetical protein